MMDELYGWVRNITFYLIFITVVTNLLPNKKYERYLKLFAGMVLILIVIQPLTGSLRLENKIAYYFEAISFQNDADDLKKELLGVEDKRLQSMITQYEEAVTLDLESMARDAGYYPVQTNAVIEGSQESDRFGTVQSVFMTVTAEENQDLVIPADIETIQGIEPVEAVEPVIIDGNAGESQPDKAKSREERQEDNSALSTLRRKISDYYDLEAEHVEIQMEYEP